MNTKRVKSLASAYLATLKAIEAIRESECPNAEHEIDDVLEALRTAIFEEGKNPNAYPPSYEDVRDAWDAWIDNGEDADALVARLS